MIFEKVPKCTYSRVFVLVDAKNNLTFSDDNYYKSYSLFFKTFEMEKKEHVRPILMKIDPKPKSKIDRNTCQ